MSIQSISANKRRVLLVEDNPVHRQLIKGVLWPRYEFDAVSDRQTAEALLGVSESAFDLLITDLRIPEKIGGPASTTEGLRLLRLLRENRQEAPVVLIVSAYIVGSVRREVGLLGARRIFEKPFSLKELGQFVDAELRGGNGKFGSIE